MDSRITTYFEKNFKWSIASMCEMDDDIPIVKGSHTVPKCLVSFLKLKKAMWHEAYIHFYHNDYEFDGEHGIWLDTAKYVPLLEKFKGMLSPDFSLYTNSGRIPQMWNTYRNRLLQCHLERLGFDVIPTVSWGGDATYDFCFRGIPPRSVVAVSTLGVMKSAEKRRMFEQGYMKMCEELYPEFIILYGSDKGLNLGGTPYRCFENGTYDWTHLLNEKKRMVS